MHATSASRRLCQLSSVFVNRVSCDLLRCNDFSHVGPPMRPFIDRKQIFFFLGNQFLVGFVQSFKLPHTGTGTGCVGFFWMQIAGNIRVT